MSWKRVLKWIGIAVGGLLVLLVAFLGWKVFGFHSAVTRVYDVSPLDVEAVADSITLARGRHLAESIGGCIGCHGDGLGGNRVEDLGPLGVIQAPNLTRGVGGVGNDYTDGELGRTVRHGIKRDGRTVLFMPSYEHNWWPDADIVAIVSYVRSMAPVDNEQPPTEVGLLGQILDQLGLIPLTVAARIDHDAARPDVPDPEPTAEYGQYLAVGCTGCHGEGFSGGKIPGAPSSLGVPANLTPHETGLAGWTEEDFLRAVDTGMRPDGRELDGFMPRLTKTNAVEKSALWAYLQTLPPREFGGR